jgi:hypothetical protein
MENRLIKIEIPEDDISNLLIELWQRMNQSEREEFKKRNYPYAIFKEDGSIEISESEKPETITITIINNHK